jgi:uncharacterized membrane protein
MATIRGWAIQQDPHVIVHHVPWKQSVEWLHRAWSDLRYFRGASLAHGALITLLGAVLLIIGGSHPYFLVAAVSGYLLIGPIMATGLCELSRRRQTGEPAGFDESLSAINRNQRGLLQFGAILAAILIVWFVASEMALRAVLYVPRLGLDSALWGGFTDAESSAQLLTYVGSGAVLALIVFAVSVVAVPFLIDHPDASAASAMWASIKATRANIPAMLLWSVYILALTGFGFATLLIGMIVVQPLLGHATWHAYRDLVAEHS